LTGNRRAYSYPATKEIRSSLDKYKNATQIHTAQSLFISCAFLLAKFKNAIIHDITKKDSDLPTRGVGMNQKTIKTPTPKCRLFLKMNL
jgi:hypothetical protein